MSYHVSFLNSTPCVEHFTWMADAGLLDYPHDGVFGARFKRWRGSIISSHRIEPDKYSPEG